MLRARDVDPFGAGPWRDGYDCHCNESCGVYGRRVCGWCGHTAHCHWEHSTPLCPASVAPRNQSKVGVLAVPYAKGRV